METALFEGMGGEVVCMSSTKKGPHSKTMPNFGIEELEGLCSVCLSLLTSVVGIIRVIKNIVSL